MYKTCSICHKEMVYIKTLDGGYWKCKHCSNTESDDTTNSDLR